MNPGRRRALTLAGAMVSASALAAIARPPSAGASGQLPPRLDALFPSAFGDWELDPLSRAFVRAGTGPGTGATYTDLYDQVLERTFVDSVGQRVMLSVAYAHQQSSGLQLHRPEVCYRYSGYKLGDLQPTVLRLDRRAVAATRLVAVLPGRPEPLTYWTVLGGVVVADVSAWRWRRITAVLRHRLLDGMLVRISTIDGDPPRAHALQARFADELVGAMAPADRLRVIGSPTEG